MLTKIGESVLSTLQDSNSLIVNGASHAYSPLTTYKGWQYIAFYEIVSGTRRPVIARRRLPDGAWQKCVFTEYAQTANNSHSNHTVGFSAVDGRLHMAFDHHNEVLKYRKSVAGLLDDPEAFAWTPSDFGPIENGLGGGDIVDLSYPTWCPTPTGTLLFSFRVGGSGEGDEHLYEWDGTEWTAHGVYLHRGPVPTQSAYPNGLTFGPDGKLHLTWVWRETTSGATNHSLSYAYSEDHGVTWRLNDGSLAPKPIDHTTPGSEIWPLEQNTNVSNSEGMWVDPEGWVHVVSRDNSVASSTRHTHYRRNPDTGEWSLHRMATLTYAGRAKVLTDFRRRAYLLGGSFRAYQGSPSEYGDWAVFNADDDGRFQTEPLFDRERLPYDGVVTAYCKDATNNRIVILDYRLDRLVTTKTRPRPVHAVVGGVFLPRSLTPLG